MKNTFVKFIGQKAPNGKMVLVAVVDDDFMGSSDVPNIFEFQAVKVAPTIYTGTYPTVKFNVDTIEDRDDLKGLGIGGILTNEGWYCDDQEQKDIYGIGI